MRRLPLALLLAATMHQTAAGAEAVPRKLTACGDSGEFPPFTYMERKLGRPTGNVGGFNAALLPQLLAASGRSIEITLLPWKRCVALAQQGGFDIVLDIAATSTRKKQFRLSAPYTFIHSVLVYDERRPVPVPKDAASLASLHRCEILGWDTTRASGTASSDKQSLPATMGMSFAMLTAGRCDAMVSQREVIRSLGLIEGGAWTRGLAWHPLHYLPESPLHYGVSRTVAYSQTLQTLLDEGIERMKRSGELQRVLERHLPPEPPVPQTLRACGDSAGFAPYTYAENGSVQGFNIDYLQSLLARSGRKAEVTLLPWKRCLLLAAQGQFDLVLDVASLEQRHKEFLLPQSHYSVTPFFAFRSGPAPQAPISKQELSAMRRCYVAGWNYSVSGTQEKPELIVTGSSLTAAVKMLRAGRCDILLAPLELLESLVGELQFRPVPWAPAAKLHFAVSRNVAYAQPLVDLLDEGIAHARETGAAKRLMTRHLVR